MRVIQNLATTRRAEFHETPRFSIRALILSLSPFEARGGCLHGSFRRDRPKRWAGTWRATLHVPKSRRSRVVEPRLQTS